VLALAAAVVMTPGTVAAPVSPPWDGNPPGWAKKTPTVGSPAPPGWTVTPTAAIPDRTPTPTPALPTRTPTGWRLLLPTAPGEAGVPWLP